MIKWLGRLFESLETYSPLQRRGFLLLLPTILLLFLLAELWRSYRIRQLQVDTTDYLVLRQWVVGLRDTLDLSASSTKEAGRWHEMLCSLPKADLNKATALELQRIRGIGVVMSRRIVLYRESLGGFHSLAQLSEIKRLRSVVRERIGQCYDLRSKVLPLHINRASAETLSMHPYFSEPLAMRVVAGQPFSDILDFKRRVALTEKKLAKLRPYLSFVP